MCDLYSDLQYIHMTILQIWLYWSCHAAPKKNQQCRLNFDNNKLCVTSKYFSIHLSVINITQLEYDLEKIIIKLL